MSDPGVSRRAVPALIVVLACAGLAGCGGSDETDGAPAPTVTSAATAASRTMLDTDKVARDITSAVRRQRHVKATVRCPEGVRQAKGVNFVCRATSKFGVTEFAVVQRDATGRVRYVAADDSQ